MLNALNKSLDWISEYLAHRKGLLLMLSILFVATNFLLQIIPGIGWFARNNFFLHAGVILGLIGVMVAWAL